MEFMPHGHCYFWTPGLVWLQVVSNAVTGLAYLWIATELFKLVRTLALPFSQMFVAFGAFILLCGLTHFMDVLVIWHPYYWVDGGIRAATGLVSIVTAIGLRRLHPQARKFANRVEQEREAVTKELSATRSHAEETQQQAEQFARAMAAELEEAREALMAPSTELRTLREKLAAAEARIAELEARGA